MLSLSWHAGEKKRSYFMIVYDKTQWFLLISHIFLSWEFDTSANEN